MWRRGDELNLGGSDVVGSGVGGINTVHCATYILQVRWCVRKEARVGVEVRDICADGGGNEVAAEGGGGWRVQRQHHDDARLLCPVHAHILLLIPR